MIKQYQLFAAVLLGIAGRLIAIECPALDDPENGQVLHQANDGSGSAMLYSGDDVSRFHFGSEVMYTCNEGYSLVGDGTRTCVVDSQMETNIGVWNGTAPSCDPIECLPLADLENGLITYDDNSTLTFELGHVATLMCDQGYSLVGNSTRTCMDDDQMDTIGVWSGTAPICKAIMCPTLDNPVDGDIEYSQLAQDGVFEILTVSTYSCDEGYLLVGNSTRTCMDDDQMDTIGVWNGTAPTCENNATYLLYTGDSFIGKIDVDGTNFTTLPLDSLFLSGADDIDFPFLSGAVGIDYDYLRGLLYWYNNNQNRIFAASLDGSNPESRAVYGEVNDIAMDWVSNKLYWTDTFHQRIEVLDLEKRTIVPVTIALVESFSTASIAVDPYTRHLYWTAPGKIERASMDGSNREILHTDQVGEPHGITIDYQAQTIYWTDSTYRIIDYSNVDGTNRQRLLSDLGFPFAITTVGNLVIFTDFVNGIFATHKLDGGTVITLSPNAQPMRIKAISVSQQSQSAINYCDGSTCEHVCLLSSSDARNYTCACRDGYILDADGQNCNFIGSTPCFSAGSTGCCANGLCSIDIGTISCWCDTICRELNDCCFDIDLTCPLFGSCVAQNYTECCTGIFCPGSTPDCFCDANCYIRGDCCQDIDLSCPRPSSSCADAGYSTCCTDSFCLGVSYNESASDCFCDPRCRDSGNCCDDIDTTCPAIECQVLNDPENGQVVHPEGSSTLNTDSSGSAMFYSGDDGSRFTITFHFGAEVMYTCNQGYSLVGDGTRTCVVDSQMETNIGVWSGTAPSCDPIECLPLADLENGLITYDDNSTLIFELGHVATLMCDQGYSLVGNSTRTCMDDDQMDTIGVWSGTAPICEAIMCPTLDNPVDGDIEYSQLAQDGVFEILTVSTYSCDEGYLLVGNSTRTCMDDDQMDTIGVWSGTAPTCPENITCSSLENLLNGQIYYSIERQRDGNYVVGTEATFDCDAGYALVGDDSRTCVEDDLAENVGMWNGTAPSCDAIMCPTLDNPVDGEIEFSQPAQDGVFEILTVSTYSCDEGYLLVGNSTRTCMDDDQMDIIGVWSGTAPMCRENITCTSLESPVNGQIHYDTDRRPNGNYVVGTAAVFSCDAGYAVVGNLSRICEDDNDADTIGEWSNANPSCQAITCSSLDALENGHIIYDVDSTSIHEFGTVATHLCDATFALVGNTRRTCIKDDHEFIIGVWSGSVPSCQPIACPMLELLQNGETLYSSVTLEVGATSTHTCDTGYSLVGSEIRECMDDNQMDTIGVWSGEVASCERIMCHALFLDHGNIKYTTCDDLQYEYETDESLSCNVDIVDLEYEYGTVAKLSCNEDFVLVGNHSRTCTGDGNNVRGHWTGILTYCDAGQCVYDNVFPFVDVTAFPGYKELGTNTEDPSSQQINIPDEVVFGDDLVGVAVYVSENGVISFGVNGKFFYPERFPTTDDIIMRSHIVAPFWSDNDIRKEGSVRYATYSLEDSNNPVGAELLSRLNDYIQTLEEEEFHGRWLLVVHWDRVHPSPHGAKNTNNIPPKELNKVNNYQAIIVSGVVRAYAVFSYICGEMEWSAVGANNHAVVGFNAGPSSDSDSESFYKNYRLSGLPGVEGNISCEVTGSNLTNLIIRLPATENVYQQNKLDCILALENDARIVGEKSFDELASLLNPCPCTRSQVLEDDGSFIQQKDAPNCFVSVSPKSVEISQTKLTLTQQCCYHGNYYLITSPTNPSSGTILLHHPNRDPNNFNQHDKALRDTCCTQDKKFCDKFYQQRKINNCQGYVGPKVSSGTGDPHYWTFDGRYHTFNGRGDFTIMEILSEDGTTPEFSINGRFATVRLWSVSTHQGLAFGNENLAFYVATSASGPNGFRVYQTRPDPPTEITFLLQNQQAWFDDTLEAMLKKVSGELILVFLETGVSCRVRTNYLGSNEYYMDLFVKVPGTVASRTQGFLGSPDGNVNNDLFARGQGQNPLPLYFGDRELYSHMITWILPEGQGLFYNGESLVRRKRQEDNDTNSLTTEPATEVTPLEPMEEFIPIFLDELNFTDAQIELCEGNEQCLFDFAVTGEEDFAMETLNGNKETQDARDTINNFPPNITANATFRVNLGEEAVFSLYVVDPGDNFTLEIEGGLPVNSTLLEDLDGEYIFTWNISSITNETLEFVANDTRGATTVFTPRVEVCPCTNEDFCTLVGVDTDSATVLLNCQCSEAFSGTFCEEDRDGCTEIQCFEGVECIDVPAPGVGAECGPCPAGFTGDSQKCYDIDECAEDNNCSQICVNTRGTFFCTCFDGYQLVEGTSLCEDINECNGVNDCQQVCENTEGSYNCSCNEGFTLAEDNRTCNADVPCGGDCSFGCAVVNGLEQCYCPNGFKLLTPNGTLCIDVDECQSAESPCEQLCNNTEGSFQCGCREGYVLEPNNRNCGDVDECFEAALQDEEPCERNSQCTNTVGSFNCTCVPGYVEVGDVCQPIVCLELSIPNGSVEYVTDITSPFELGTTAIYSCSPGFTIMLHEGVNHRVCQANFSNPLGIWTGSAPSCEDINECSVERDESDDMCHANSMCVNTVGSFECMCVDGYVLVDGTCELITTSAPTPPTLSPEVQANTVVLVILPGYSSDSFNTTAQQRFKDTTAEVINAHCSQSDQNCQELQTLKRQANKVIVSAEDIIITDIQDEEGVLTFLMYVQLDGGLLMASDLQEAIEGGDEMYNGTGFSGLTSQLLTPVATTSQIPTSVLSSEAIFGIVLGSCVMIMAFIFGMIFIIIICRKKCRGGHKNPNANLMSSSMEYRNPLAEEFEQKEAIQGTEKAEEGSDNVYQVEVMLFDAAEKEEGSVVENPALSG